MTEAEFAILDELYFVTSYNELGNQLELDQATLIKELTKLYEKGWLRVFKDPNDTLDIEILSEEVIMNSYLLASKAGLKAHNQV